ncbi:tetratricopeptide repeat protein [Streptomyces sp. NPDC051704]|uniref:tetratricopeptide repeat protein n=1 Tax=Streptomyces sp. NPDC051704 TaxID=3365671 RepID=UPI0037B945D3
MTCPCPTTGEAWSCTALRSTQGQSAARNSLCLATWYVGDLNEALRHGERCAELGRSTGFRTGEAIATGNVGAILHETGRLAEAEEQLTPALVLYDELGFSTAAALAERNLGAVLHKRGHPERARAALDRAVAIQRRLGNQVDIPYTLFWLALTMIRSGDRSGALDHIEQGFEMATGEARAESYLYVGRAMLSQSVGNYGVALKHFETARGLARRCNARTPAPGPAGPGRQQSAAGAAGRRGAMRGGGPGVGRSQRVRALRGQGTAPAGRGLPGGRRVRARRTAGRSGGRPSDRARPPPVPSRRSPSPGPRPAWGGRRKRSPDERRCRHHPPSLAGSPLNALVRACHARRPSPFAPEEERRSETVVPAVLVRHPQSAGTSRCP